MRFQNMYNNMILCIINYYWIIGHIISEIKFKTTIVIEMSCFHNIIQFTVWGFVSFRVSPLMW